MKEIICLTTYPPRECGIATFSEDLIRAIETKFGESFSVKVCALESSSEQHGNDVSDANINIVVKNTIFFLNYFFNDTATTEIYTLSLHDALPI